MTKALLSGAIGVGMLTLASPSANASLAGRLPATLGGTDWQAYYDDQLDITWAANANINGATTWDLQVDWVAGLTIGGVGGWRLPNMDKNGDGAAVDCSTATQMVCKDNEYGHLYYYGAGTTLFNGIWSSNQPPFNGIQNFLYWSSNVTVTHTTLAKAFAMSNGTLSQPWTENIFYAWAVHSGDVGNMADTDGDGLVDNADNCIFIPNGPLDPDAGGNSQLDSDGDGYGNICDPDFDNNHAVDFSDLAYLKSKFFAADPDADHNGDGTVDFADLAILKSMFFGPPGPSGLEP